MKINTSIFVTFGLISIFITACQLDPCANKDKFLTSFDQFVEDISESEKEFTLEQWEENDSLFKKYVEECYVNHKEELVLAEKKTFWANSIRYYYQRHGGSFFTELEDASDPLAQTMEQELEEVYNNPKEVIIALVKEEYGEDISKGIDKVVNEIKKIGEEIKDIFNK